MEGANFWQRKKAKNTSVKNAGLSFWLKILAAVQHASWYVAANQWNPLRQQKRRANQKPRSKLQPANPFFNYLSIANSMRKVQFCAHSFLDEKIGEQSVRQKLWMVGRTGLEPATFCTSSRCPNRARLPAPLLLETELEFKFSGSWNFRLQLLNWYSLKLHRFLFLLSLGSSFKAMGVLYLLLKFIECLWSANDTIWVWFWNIMVGEIKYYVFGWEVLLCRLSMP